MTLIILSQNEAPINKGFPKSKKNDRGHLLWLAQRVLGGAHQAWEVGCSPDRQGGGGDCEVIAPEGGNPAG